MSSPVDDSIESLYHEAYALVDQGICYDEIGNREGALAMYERGLSLIDRAGQLPNATQHQMYMKMAAAREHILYRLKDLRSGTEADSGAPEGLPPAYEVINGAIDAFGDSKSAEQLFEVPGGVQIFYIDGEETSIPSYPSGLKIFKFNPDSPREESSGASGSSSEPPAFMQVDDWVYPLLPGRSPVLHSTFGAYVFPNPTVDNPELCVGIILPQDLDEATMSEFNSILNQYTEYRQQAVAPQLSQAEHERLSSKVSKYLIATAEYVAWGVQKGTEKGSEYLKKEGEKQRAKLGQNEKATHIDPRLQTSVHYLRKGTKVAVKISGYLVNEIGKAAVKIGTKAAAKAEKRVSQKSKAGGSLVGDAVELVKGGIVSFSTVWMGLEEAAKILAKNIANETVMTVEHKYGNEAGVVTKDALWAAGHGTMTAYNITELGPKAIAKRTAKHAGIGFLQDLSKEKEPKTLDTEEKQASQK